MVVLLLLFYSQYRDIVKKIVMCYDIFSQIIISGGNDEKT